MSDQAPSILCKRSRKALKYTLTWKVRNLVQEHIRPGILWCLGRFGSMVHYFGANPPVTMRRIGIDGKCLLINSLDKTKYGLSFPGGKAYMIARFKLGGCH